MASRVLLISANSCTSPDPVFPLGLAHLTSALRRAGNECVWLDTLANAGDFARLLRQSRADCAGISLRNIDDVLIRKKETFFQDLPALVDLVRREVGCPVILGGSGFSIFPERLLDLSHADYGIAGEGEAGLVALIESLRSGAKCPELPGLVYRENGRVKVNPAACFPFDGAIEQADRPSAATDHYLRTGSMLNLQTQRGCSFRCCYCTYPVIEGRQHRRRAPEQVAEDFAQVQQAGAKYVFVVDSVFNTSPRHVTETCEAILKRGVKLPWGCFLRPHGLTPDLMRLMARAGLAHIEFGTDSFCDEVLEAYGKDFTFDDILRSSELAQSENLDFCHFLICGGPGETRRTLDRGFENSQRLRSGVIMAVVGMRIYPCTELFGRAVAEGKIAADADLLKPTYYVSPGLDAGEIFSLLQDFSRRSPNWIVGDPDPAYQNLVDRLRRRGVAGPLWSYFSMIQRLWPQGTPR